MDCQGAQSQKEGQEDQGEVKELGGTPLMKKREYKQILSRFSGSVFRDFG